MRCLLLFLTWILASGSSSLASDPQHELGPLSSRPPYPIDLAMPILMYSAQLTDATRHNIRLRQERFPFPAERSVIVEPHAHQRHDSTAWMETFIIDVQKKPYLVLIYDHLPDWKHRHPDTGQMVDFRRLHPRLRELDEKMAHWISKKYHDFIPEEERLKTGGVYDEIVLRESLWEKNPDFSLAKTNRTEIIVFELDPKLAREFRSAKNLDEQERVLKEISYVLQNESAVRATFGVGRRLRTPRGPFRAAPGIRMFESRDLIRVAPMETADALLYSPRAIGRRLGIENFTEEDRANVRKMVLASETYDASHFRLADENQKHLIPLLFYLSEKRGVINRPRMTEMNMPRILKGVPHSTLLEAMIPAVSGYEHELYYVYPSLVRQFFGVHILDFLERTGFPMETIVQTKRGSHFLEAALTREEQLSYYVSLIERTGGVNFDHRQTDTPIWQGPSSEAKILSWSDDFPSCGGFLEQLL